MSNYYRNINKTPMIGDIVKVKFNRDYSMHLKMIVVSIEKDTTFFITDINSGNGIKIDTIYFRCAHYDANIEDYTDCLCKYLESKYLILLQSCSDRIQLNMFPEV